MGKILAGLKLYIRNNSNEQINKDWAETEKYDDVLTPTLESYPYLQELFEHMSLDHKLTLTNDEMHEIISICDRESKRSTGMFTVNTGTQEKAKIYAKKYQDLPINSRYQKHRRWSFESSRDGYLAGHQSRDEEVKCLRELIKSFVYIEERIFGLKEKSYVPEIEVLELMKKAKDILKRENNETKQNEKQ